MSAERVGIFELSEKGQAKTVDVVAVHGILGHPFKTWEHENGKLWLKDFLAKDLPSARIMTFGYDSAVAFSKGVGTIENNARYLLNQLSAERAASGSQGSDRRPIVFICHSLGGIIVKKALVLAHESSFVADFKDILDNTKAMAFLSVPHRGSDAAWWGDLGANILKSASMGIWTNRRLIKDLKKQSPALMDISKQFVPRSQSLTIYAFYERRKTGPILVGISFKIHRWTC